MTEESVDVVVCAASHFASAAYCAQSGSRWQRITRSRRSLIRHGESSQYRIRYAEPLDFSIICYHCSEWFLLLDTETTEQRIFSTMAKKRTESRIGHISTWHGDVLCEARSRVVEPQYQYNPGG